VLDTRELGRRPGAQRERQLTVAAPAGLGTDVFGVPEGAELELFVRLESVVEGILASGTVQAPVAGECVRCLEPIERSLTVEFQELYAYDERAERAQQVGGVDGDAEDEIGRIADDQLDLEPAVRDAVVLALPFQPVCRDDCPGLCATCGANLAADPEHRHEAQLDPRWAALAQLNLDTEEKE
jgi:uncharacterized protein